MTELALSAKTFWLAMIGDAALAVPKTAGYSIPRPEYVEIELISKP